MTTLPPMLYLDYIVKGAAAVGIVLGFLRWVWRPIYRLAVDARALLMLVPTMRSDLAAVRAQIFPNGGSSLADVLADVASTTNLTAQRLDFVLRFHDVAIYETDAAGTCTFANHALCELFGLSPQEMMGEGWLSAIHSDDRLKVSVAWHEMRAKGIPYEATYRVVNCRTGETFMAITRALAHRSPKGQVLGYVGIVRTAGDKRGTHLWGTAG